MTFHLVGRDVRRRPTGVVRDFLVVDDAVAWIDRLVFARDVQADFTPAVGATRRLKFGRVPAEKGCESVVVRVVIGFRPRPAVRGRAAMVVGLLWRVEGVGLVLVEPVARGIGANLLLQTREAAREGQRKLRTVLVRRDALTAPRCTS